MSSKNNSNPESQNHIRRKNKKDNQLSKRNDRKKKETGNVSDYIEKYDLPEGAFNNTIPEINKIYLKKELTEDSISSDSVSPPVSDDDTVVKIKNIQLNNTTDEYEYYENYEEEVFDDSYFEPQVYVEPKKK
jgi:hypothetical protein